MGFWRRARSLFTRQQFSASTPRPIDQLIYEMMHSSGRVTRAEALSVPAVLRGRNKICDSVSTLPLTQFGPDRRAVSLSLLDQIDPDVANVVTLAQTVEDLLFEGISWWRKTGYGWDGFPTSARHLDFSSVSLNPPEGRSPAPLPSGYDPRGGVVWVDGVEVEGRELIRFDSPNPGLLHTAGRSIRKALLLDRTTEMYADNPRPLDYLSAGPEAEDLDDDEVPGLLAKWRAWRKGGSTAYLPKALIYNSVDSPTPADMQLVELQKQAWLEIANAIGLDPEDLGVSTTSRTYFNAVDRRQTTVNEVYSPYMQAITSRLSMGDVTKRGYRVAFDLDDYLRADPLTRWQTYEIANRMGAITVDEIRSEENLPMLTPAQRRQLAPPPQTPAAASSTPPPVRVENVTGRALTSFASAKHTFVDVPVQQFKVDVEARTIEGLALPYGKVGQNHNGKFRFAPGALQYSEMGRNKLLRDHEMGQALGRLVFEEERPEGKFVRYKVARGAAGDEALILADDGVLDGFSVGVEFDYAADTVPDPDNKGVALVRRADWFETSLTAMPAFDDARVTRVAASRDQGEHMETEETSVAAPAAPDFNAMFAAFMATQNQPQGPTVVNATRQTATTQVNEAKPYRFDRAGTLRRGTHEFSSDVFAWVRGQDETAHNRVMEFAREQFVVTTDVDELNPTRQRPDMYVDQRAFLYPVWNTINKGNLGDITPFTFPKFSSAATLVSAHVEGTEPALGTFVSTSQTVTPGAKSGKMKLAREVVDQGGNPQVSGLIWRKMVQAWYEALEAAAVAILDAATPTGITLTTGGGTTGQTLDSELTAAFAGLQFIRGGFSMDSMFTQIDLYKALIAAKDTAGRRLYPAIGPQNASGTVSRRFAAVDVNGVTALPSWALAATGVVAASSYLFDREEVHGWASAPQRIDIDRTEVANVYIGLFGYVATAISDINGVREVIYDPA